MTRFLVHTLNVFIACFSLTTLANKSFNVTQKPPEPEWRPVDWWLRGIHRRHAAINDNNEDLFEYHNPNLTDDGVPLIESDIVTIGGDRQAETNLWNLPVLFAVGHSDRAAILAGINHWRQHTCVTFREVSVGSSQAHLHFYRGSGCWSFVGKSASSGGQQVSIGNGCTQLGTVVHEIGHALGLHHQQSRTDRDQYVSINYGNIQQGASYNFQIATGSLTHGVPYDLTSVMHYGAYYFSANGRKTISTRNAQHEGLIGNRQQLSHRDKHIAHVMYRCASHCTSPPRCQNGGFVDKNCQCQCPPHTSGSLCQTASGSYYFPGSGPVTGSDCGDPDMRSEGTITSPDYPNNYPKNVDCVWKITAPAGQHVRVTMADMKLLYRHEDGVCYWDYINFRYTVDEGPDDFQACDDELKGRGFTSNGTTFMVTFHSGNYGWYRGFSATVEFVDGDGGGGECRDSAH